MFPCVPQHLSISNGNIQVDASFMQTLWNVHPICSGSNIEEGRDFTQNFSDLYFFTMLSTILSTKLYFQSLQMPLKQEKYIYI